MLRFLKNNAKNVAIGGSYGASIGAAAGSAVGAIVSNKVDQACTDSMIIPSCRKNMPPMHDASLQLGAGVGAAIGFGVGAITYSSYKAFVGWYYDSSKLQQIKNEENDTELSVDENLNDVSETFSKHNF